MGLRIPRERAAENRLRGVAPFATSFEVATFRVRVGGIVMHPAFARTEHRPWPVPTGRWRYRQAWCDLLLAHWEVPAEKLRPHLPKELTLDEFVQPV